MDDLLSEFLTETSENLAVIDVELVKLEQNPEPRILSNIFRLVHTVKGTCGFLGLPRLEAVAHAAENVLGKFRDAELPVTAGAVTLILASIDRIKLILSHIESHEGAEPEGDDRDLIARLNETAEGGLPPASEPEMAAASAFAPVAVAVADGGGDLIAVAAGTQAELAPAAAPPALVASPETQDSAVALHSIRVNVEVLENLMTLVSELVLARNQLLQMIRGQDDSEFAGPLQRLSHITSDLQEGVMKTRMQPIGNAWAKLPRIIRDLSVESGKKIDLQMVGAETELDRQVLELIKDPLTHMIRNSADHGLEPVEQRRSAGKPDIGRIVLKAFHEGGHIVIAIADDGRGLNIGRIREKALANGLAAKSEIEQMTDQQVAQFIFKAGFSTAETVTSVSGRGVGMDVVRTNIERIGGSIELATQAGKGTTFTIRIPLTLAIVSALIIESAAERFAIPQLAVVELVRANKGSEHAIERIKDAPVLRLRDRLLPLVSLRRILELGQGRAADGSETFIVVVQVAAHRFGILVDKVFDTEEIVVKPVAPILRDIPVFAGNTILGDGSVIMILDPNGIAAASGTMIAGAEAIGEAAELPEAGSDDERRSLLVFRAGNRNLKAVPLALIARLENVDVAALEYSNGRPVVQYRDHLMPLVAIDESFRPKSEGSQPILVFSDRDRIMGLMVDEIVDIVEDRLRIELAVDRPGVIGTALLAGRATDIIDASHFLTQAWGDWFGPAEAVPSAPSDGKRVLLVDDSPFFRNLLAPLLSVEGYRVTTVESADKALSLRDSGKVFDLIVSDIEMPGMSGFDFAEAVRADGSWSAIPMVALTSRFTEPDMAHGRQAGFNDYVAKSDREALLQSLAHTLLMRGAA